MELLDRYLKTVRPLLPEAERDDILAELSEEIRGQMRERELDLGRPLSEREQDEILQRFGNPYLVSGRYHPYQGTLTFGRELVGRELFPHYARTLKITFAISIAATIAIHIGLTYAQITKIGQLFQALVYHLPIQFAVITLVFAWLQRYIERNPEKWDMREFEDGVMAVDANTKARFNAIVDFVVAGVVLSWIQGSLWPVGVRFGAGTLTPVWHQAYWPLAGVTVLTMAHAALTALQPALGRWRESVRALATAVWFGTFLYLWFSGPWVVSSRADSVQEVRFLNDVVLRYGILGMVAVLGISLVWELSVLCRRSRARDRQPLR
jgi:hypothetical protein